jgi:hypothetical protein
MPVIRIVSPPYIPVSIVKTGKGEGEGLWCRQPERLGSVLNEKKILCPRKILNY